MSNKTTVTKVIGFLGRMGTRLTNFMHYKILSNKKSLLLLGGDSLPEFRNSLIDHYSSNWKITSIASTQSKTDLHIPFTSLSPQEYRNIEEETRKFTKLYDSIVVLPSKTPSVSFDDPEILSYYLDTKPSQMELSLVAYKLASKMLTPNGVIVVTGSQKAFFGEKGVSPIKYLQSFQCSCLNTIMGERDYTDVNSYSLMALTDDLNLEDKQAAKKVIDLMKHWSQGTQLPYPGSFAKIVSKNSVNFPEFF